MTTPVLIFIGADKGGVGKTTVARALIDYLTGQGLQLRIFDTEPGETGVLKRFFQAAELVNINCIPGQMAVIDAATPAAVTLVDAHAGLLTPLLKAFARMKLLDDVRAGALRLLVLHVVGSSVASASEVPAVMAALKGADLVQVNNYVSAEASFPAPAPDQKVIAVPNLDEEACAAVDQANESFRKFADNPKRSRVLRGYVGTWLSEVFAEFDRIGIGKMPPKEH